MAETDAVTLTAIEAAEKIADGELSAEEYVGACLDRIAAIEDTVHAFTHLDPDYAIAQARERDGARRDGRALGPLHGIPVAVKDIFDTADYPTECGSPLFKGRRPTADCAVVARLREAGAVIIGKSVTTEFAYYHPGKTRNPHDPERTPGGSSSGSAAAVAADMVPLAIGSQTNGSVIRPASFCGVYGLKPSHGRISRAGALTLSRTLDHVGVFTRTLADAALLLDVLAGYDPADPDTRAVASPDFFGALDDPPPSPRFAFVRTPIWDQADPQTREAFEALAEGLGDAVESIDMPEDYAAAWDDHRAVMAVEMAHNQGALVARGGEASSQTLRDLMALGEQVTATRYLAACAAARRYAAGLDDVFAQFDAILTPATPGVAPRGNATGNPAFCTFWTLTGLPAVSLPLLTGEADMPLGVQLVSPAGEDARLLRAANWLIAELQDG